MYCVCLLCMLCIYCFPPLLMSGSLDDRYRCPYDRLRHRRSYPPPYRRASRQAVPLHLSHISPTCLYLSVALGICCCYVAYLFNCIACFCRPLIYLSLSYAAYYIYYIQQLALRLVSQLKGTYNGETLPSRFKFDL